MRTWILLPENFRQHEFPFNDCVPGFCLERELRPLDSFIHWGKLEKISRDDELKIRRKMSSYKTPGVKGGALYVLEFHRMDGLFPARDYQSWQAYRIARHLSSRLQAGDDGGSVLGEISRSGGDR